MNRWLPRGYALANGTTAGKILSFGDTWQLYTTSNQGYVLAVAPALYKKWEDLAVLPSHLFEEHGLLEGRVYIVCEDYSQIIASVKQGPHPKNYAQSLSFAKAMNNSRRLLPSDSFADALYFERLVLLLPTFTGEEADDQSVLYTWIASGVELGPDKFGRLSELVSWMSPTTLSYIVREAGFPISDNAVLALEKTKQQIASSTDEPLSSPRTDSPLYGNAPFSLPGRPMLETFFNEHIVEIVRNKEKYQRMGINFPSTILLHGPPGCGKTYAVERLVEYLGWNKFTIDSDSIASTYLHGTSQKISELFDKAIRCAPSVVIMDEVEAFLFDRAQSHNSLQHHGEEVAEFLRRIPEASSHNVLVIGMTNMLHSIDPAILRRGRFDHIVEVGMPSAEEIASLLQNLFSKLPIANDVSIDKLASHLQGYAMSDVNYVVKEAGRLAVRENQEFIGSAQFQKVLATLPKKEANKRKIGF